ncbi:DegT/DnrJ/EryC1/StrS family aminotransferase [Pseudoalteromonas aurantia]|uniref:DegT/DnrJ/EryC1/StrS family aminotransferase n=1 Tax=Pseudoalteromonas aurantia TaxID=43654 RepID=UPI00110BDEF2|nr:DegT/DnrJ/EryC1/StrS family aminotransferase [Pseudoalteromonas aurantia]TMO67089.1 DegT/DnrJ/EryC1/StrS family aminotransferase [Pseudoalteromonas aurantia]
MKYPIVKPYLPPLENYQNKIENIFNSGWLTNNGPCVQELEKKLAEYLGVEHVLLVANGTLALSVAYMALEVSGKVLTTPYSFAATASSLLAGDLEPEFIDIDPQTLNLDINSASQAQLEKASAVVAVHVYGNPCNDEQIKEQAAQYNLKVIYDAAHTFGATYNGKALLSYGDAATLSLHATKIFHSLEGGAIIFKHKEDYLRAKQIINFGFDSQQYPGVVGINAKMSEVHAAMGLSLLPLFPDILTKRQALWTAYQNALENDLTTIKWSDNSKPNGCYFPVLLNDEAEVLFLISQLAAHGIQTRRYFYPSLNTVPAYGMSGCTPIANDTAQRVLCLPMYTELSLEGVGEITQILLDRLRRYRTK